jgi:hypothetical protein
VSVSLLFVFLGFHPFSLLNTKIRRSPAYSRKKTHLGTFMAMKRYTGIAESTNRTKAVMPSRFRREAFQLGRWLAILSTHCTRSLLPNFLSETGSPK